MDGKRTGWIRRFFLRRPYATRRELFYWRCVQVHATLGVLLMAALLVFAFPLWLRIGGLLIPVTFWACLWLVPLRRANRRAYAVLREREFLICPRCTYDLRGATSPCPECGRAFDAHDLRETWTEHYRAHVSRKGWSDRLPGD